MSLVSQNVLSKHTEKTHLLSCFQCTFLRYSQSTKVGGAYCLCKHVLCASIPSVLHCMHVCPLQAGACFVYASRLSLQNLLLISRYFNILSLISSIDSVI